MTRAQDLMETVVTTVEHSLSLLELQQLLVAEGIGGAPVVDGDRLVGVVSRSDVVRTLADEWERAEQLVSDFYEALPLSKTSAWNIIPRDTDQVATRLSGLTVREVMNPRVISVPPDEPIEAVAACLIRYRIHRVLVTEEERLVGIVSSLDLVQLLAAASRPIGEPAGRTEEEVVLYTPDAEAAPSPLFPGDVRVAVLREGGDGTTTLLARISPGGYIAARKSEGAVQHFVVSGQCESEGQVFRAGTYRRLPNGLQQRVTSRDGAVILILSEPRA